MSKRAEHETSEKESTAADLLKQKRQARAEAQQRYELAKAARDERAMADETRLIAALDVLIPELERDVEAATAAAHTRAAQARMKGIARAHGSLCAELDEDASKVHAALDAARAAIKALNDRHRSIELLQLEARALSDRFGIAAPTLRAVVAPAGRTFDLHLPSPTHGWHPSPSIEECEHRLRAPRRDYKEIRGTEGYALIQSAGLKAWPSLTAKQERVVAERNPAADPMLQEEAVIATALVTIGAPHGLVHRG